MKDLVGIKLIEFRNAVDRRFFCRLIMAALTNSAEQLSRRHGIKLVPAVECSVEDCALAVGEAVGYDSIVSASRMNGAVVIFLDSLEKVHSVVQSGVVIRDTFIPAMPLTQPARKIILSNVPPFIKDELLITELSRYGKTMSQMKKIPLGCKSALLKHVVSFRRQIYMILNNGVDGLNVAFKFRVDGSDYVVFASSDTMRCYECGMEGHLKRNCTAQAGDKNASGVEVAQENTAPAGVNEQQPADNANVSIENENTNGAGMEQADHVNVEATVQGQSVDNVNDGDSTGEERGMDHDAASGDVVSTEENDGKVLKTCNVAEAAGSILNEEDMNVDFENDETLFKTPVIKRKRSSKLRKANEERTEQQDSRNDDFDCSTQEDSDGEAVSPTKWRNVYTFERVRLFLQKTKNMKNVQVVDYFPDQREFVDSVVSLMRSKDDKQFTAQEVYRLKKFVSKVKLELRSKDGFETT